MGRTVTMRNSAIRALALVCGFTSLADTLLVAPGSPCASVCGNELSSTSPDEIVCNDSGYKTTTAGSVWQQCITCQLTSAYYTQKNNKNDTDLNSLLYNLRFNVDECLFKGGFEEVGPCITSTACGPLLDAVEYGNFTTSVGTYDYCKNWEMFQEPKCTGCLQPSGFYLYNYVTVLEAACEQQPPAGTVLSLQGGLFSNQPVVITTPAPTYSMAPAPDFGPVSLGARVGIAFGALAFILALLGCCVVCNGKRRRRAFLRELEKRHAQQGWPNPNNQFATVGGAGGEMFETPVSQKALRNWDESPISAGTERTLPRYFSPYQSQYSSPISAGDGGPSAAANANWPALSPQHLTQLMQEQQQQQQQMSAHGTPPPSFSQWPNTAQEKLMIQMQHHERRQNEIAIGIALGGDEASLRSKPSNNSINNSNGYPIENKGKDRDEMYEMTAVESPYNGSSDTDRYRMPAAPDTPVLHHPGYGRQHGSRPGTGSSGGRNISRSGSAL
ncbi:hypothetical protein B0T26DRAFT_163552 [Lasiosphaeria miniovina]|uniref:Lpxtg-domain-containing protein n=1 Tax=Lasiosphaeria miniovina TaxID=1954250 RepID=A0AA40E4T7_9PEZI|nr:uncharacterized protein B0T26DRAFT_163552 [Lasiosphaeria miniovina]KAK0728209.1 hypothetical protein B0T26DRAFT_163552 [Lasiosphaeria miniovina]